MTAFSRSKGDLRSIEPASNPNAEPHRRNVVLSLWNHRWLILIITLIFLAAAVVKLSRATAIFQAATRLTVSQNHQSVVGTDPNAYSMDQQDFRYTQAEIIKSRTVLQSVASLDDVRKMQTFQTPENSNVLAYLQMHVNTLVGRMNDIITVTVSGPYPEDDAKLANLVVDAYDKYVGRQRHGNTAEILHLLRDEKGKYDKDIEDLRDKKLAFQRDNATLIIANDRISPTLNRLDQLQSELTIAEHDSITAQSDFETTKAMTTDPSKVEQLLQSRALRSESGEVRQQIRQLQQQLSGMTQNYLPGMPEFGKANSMLKQLNDQKATEDKAIVDAYISELETRAAYTKRNEAALQALYNQQKQEVMELTGKKAEFDKIDSELKAMELYDADLSKKVQDLSVVEDANIPIVNQVDEADAKECAQIEPNPAMTMFEALVGGLLLGCLLAFGRDWIDQRMRSVDEIKSVVQLPVLGVVPHIIGGRTPSQRGMQLHLDPMSDVAEAYRTIRTGVYFGTPGGTAKTLLITSPSPGDGKSTLASNLSVAMAQAGNRILLLDADFRKPMQHKIFGITSGQGLSNVLAGSIELDAAIHETVVPNLSILPCGPIPANPSEILNSQSFADVLDHLVESFDHVILDSPPVMPVTDSRILAASCDVTIMALRAEKSTRKGAVYARDTLRSVGARLLGVVVNDVPRRKGIYGYYYSDSYLYQYGYGNNGRGKRAVANGNGASNGNGAKQLPTATSSG